MLGDPERLQAERRAALLVDTTSRLLAARSVEACLYEAALMAVPELADACAAFALENDKLRCAGAVHRDAERDAAVRALGEALEGVPEGAVGEALRGGPPLLVSDLAAPVDAELRPHLDKLGAASIISIALHAREKMLGALLLVVGGGRRYDDRDLVYVLDLAHRVALVVDNVRLLSEAERAVAVRDEFVSVASHELRTPLTALRLRVQKLLQLADGARQRLSIASIRDDLVAIERQSLRLANMVGAVLDISQIASGLFELSPARVDLAELAGEVVGMLTEEADRFGERLTLIAPGQLYGRFDHGRIVQLLVNLISNAITHGGGKPIEVRVEMHGGKAVLQVRDHGVGIAPELHERIFQKFERGTSSRHHGGLGLGLFICREIAEAHGGTISVDSRVGEGSTFTVVLPVL